MKLKHFKATTTVRSAIRPHVTITSKGLSQGTFPIPNYKTALRIVKTGKASPLHEAGRSNWSLPVTAAKSIGLV